MRVANWHLSITLAAALAGPLASQQVEVQLREEASRTVIGGAIVRLLGGTEARIIDQGLSNEGGRIVLRAPAPGTYRLKVDRIGWVGVVTAPFELVAGQVFRQELILGNVRLDLPTIEVEAENVCGRQFEGETGAANLWQEIQRALTATVLSTREGLPLHMREFRRELALNERLNRSWYTRSRIVRGRVYETLPPATLSREGYVLVDEVSDSTIYAVPDAALLVSPEFTMTHCFRAVPGDDARVGLYFEPIPGRQVTDIQGTMWLDRQTHELRTLEYVYTGLPPLPRRVELGGRVDFERLPTGRWIVSYWHVRTPLVVLVESRRSVRLPGRTARPTVQVERLEGFAEVGGDVRIAGDPASILTRAVVVGRLVDPTTGGGLQGAVVAIEAVPQTVLTDEEGRFSVETEMSGERVITVAHPKLSVANHTLSVPALLSVGDTTTVTFSMPGSVVFVRAICGNPRNRAGLIGMVITPEGVPIQRATVLATWDKADGGTGRLENHSGGDGRYGLCNLPVDQPVTIQVTHATAGTAAHVVELDPRSYKWMDLVPRAR
jgi:hypothetical protein